ncbi:2974_t:CDS:1, partial [Rhizophagus irregularis]
LVQLTVLSRSTPTHKIVSTHNPVFNKVKAHSNNIYLADAEAKKGLDVPPIIIDPKFIPDATMSPMWDSLGTINKDIRKFTKKYY